jgi:hypothetical protein
MGTFSLPHCLNDYPTSADGNSLGNICQETAVTTVEINERVNWSREHVAGWQSK